MFSLHNHIVCNGGRANAGDIVACTVEGRLEAGELLLNVGLTTKLGPLMCSFISLWSLLPDVVGPVPEAPAVREPWMTRAVSVERVVTVMTDCVDHVFTYRMADDKSSALLHIPDERKDSSA